MDIDFLKLGKAFEAAAIAAGQAILVAQKAGAAARLKADNSPVTAADEEAEFLITSILSLNYPEIPVIGEEASTNGSVPDVSGGTFFLVDPLDGTKEYIAGSNEFTVNIALIRSSKPVAGIVYAPALAAGFIGVEDHAHRFEVNADFGISTRAAISCRKRGDTLTAVASRSHATLETTRFLDEHGIKDCTSIGSSLKFCLVAEGLADVYPRFGRTMEWDTAAGDAVLRAAGGETRVADGTLLKYGKTNQRDDADFANPTFIASTADWVSRERLELAVS